MRTRLTALGIPCPVVGRPALARGPGRVPRRPRRRGRRQDVPRRVRRQGCPRRAGRRRRRRLVLRGRRRHRGARCWRRRRSPFTRELAVLVARRPSGEVRTWPVVESVQRDGVCARGRRARPGPRPGDAAREALDVATRIAEGLGVTGVLAVELFEVPGVRTAPRRVLVNELAMRPHNSGHWTIDGAVTSQFEQHLRAVLDLPLGDTAPPATLDGDGQRARQHARRTRRTRWPTSPGSTRPRRCTCTARRSGRAASSGT